MPHKMRAEVAQPLSRLKANRESGTEIGHSLEFDFVVPPPHS